MNSCKKRFCNLLIWISQGVGLQMVNMMCMILLKDWSNPDLPAATVIEAFPSIVASLDYRQRDSCLPQV